MVAVLDCRGPTAKLVDKLTAYMADYLEYSGCIRKMLSDLSVQKDVAHAGRSESRVGSIRSRCAFPNDHFVSDWLKILKEFSLKH
jgi:hypothetical protein